MIISRTPFRLPIAGGGTDLPSYYKIKGGLFISASINKYVYVSINKRWKLDYLLKYSKVETVKNILNIKHPVIRAALSNSKSKDQQLEIVSVSDIPAGTGLGSSGSFTVGLLNSLHAYNHQTTNKFELAEEACNIEMNILNEPSGKQDPYAASLGGIKNFKINNKGVVKAEELSLDPDFRKEFEESLILFFTGYARSSGKILGQHKTKILKKDKEMIKNLDFVKSIALETIKAFKNKSISDYASLMNEHWQYKLKRSKNMSSSNINDLIKFGLKNDALGAKLIGAGGGGFVMFITNNKKKLRNKIKRFKLSELDVKFEYDGTTIISRG
tara:strand:+ start:2482 stop:3465 length:984 start_codon:yes stop_codon:yes gene_type:complete